MGQKRAKESTSVDRKRHVPRKRLRSHKDSTSSRKQARELKRLNVPFELECMGCKSIIPKGVQIDAVKDTVNPYYSVTKWWFTFKCAGCGCKIVLQNIFGDPKFKLIKGARRMEAEPEVKPEYWAEQQHFNEQRSKEIIEKYFPTLRGSPVNIFDAVLLAVGGRM